jgi:ABC-type uncharacterized transport system auxiliary subunit
MNKRIPESGLLPVLLSALLLQACSGVLTSQQPAKQYYLLTPYSSPVKAAADATRVELNLNVSAVPGLDTDRILALGADAGLNHYANARWPDHLPEVLTSVLQRSLEATGQFDTVRAAPRSLDQGWVLQLEVREFYGIQRVAGSTSSVAVGLAGRINCNGSHHALHLRDSSPVADERLSAVVAAHQAGLDRVTQQLIEQISGFCGD